MMAACFELNFQEDFNYRTFKSIKNTISEQFGSLEILKRIGCLPEDFRSKSVEVKHIQSADKCGNFSRTRCCCCTP